MFKTKKSGRGNSPGYKAVIFPALIAAIVFVPIVYIFSSFLLVDKYVFTHIASSILPEVAKNTIILALGTGILSVILGTTLAWLTAIYDFPFKKYFVWLLVLPIALPTYVLAFVGVGFFDYSGLFQDFLRLFGMKGFWFDGVRSAPGAIVVLSLSLYPYVYYITRSAFISQGPKALEVSELYGYSKLRTFVTVIIPMSRSYIAAGALLVIMESLADFGAVSVLNYNTLTTAIYQAWFAMFSFQTGLQISSFTLLIAVIILLTEQYTRSKMRFSQVGTATIAHKYIKLSGIKAWAAFGYCMTVLMIAFILPVTQLVVWLNSALKQELSSSYYSYLLNTFMLGIIAVIVIISVSLILSVIKHNVRSKRLALLIKLSTIGYALPGTVLAIGFFIPVTKLNNYLIDLSEKIMGEPAEFAIQSTIAVMIIGYLIRFLAVGYSTVDSSMERVSSSVVNSAKLMGYGYRSIISKIYIPLLRKGVLTAVTLVLIDVMKEMPITLMTRPFGWDTLAVKIFELTSEGEWERAAVPSFILLLFGLVPIVFLSGRINRQIKGEAK